MKLTKFRTIVAQVVRLRVESGRWHRPVVHPNHHTPADGITIGPIINR